MLDGPFSIAMSKKQMVTVMTGAILVNLRTAKEYFLQILSIS